MFTDCMYYLNKIMNFNRCYYYCMLHHQFHHQANQTSTSTCLTSELPALTFFFIFSNFAWGRRVRRDVSSLHTTHSCVCALVIPSSLHAVCDLIDMIGCMNYIISIMLSIRYNYYMTNNWIYSHVCAVIKK